MTETLLQLLEAAYPLTPIETGAFAHLKVGGMKFSIKAFCAEGLGHVSMMQAKGFFGLMKMDTLMIVPFAKDLPLYSYDRIFAMGNDTLIVELYDTLLSPLDLSSLDFVKEHYQSLPERDPGEHWYDTVKLPQSLSKKGKKLQTPAMNSLATDHFKAYLSLLAEETADKMAKKQRSSAYVEGLLSHGGPSTDVFKKSLGQAKTEELFRYILFGTAAN